MPRNLRSCDENVCPIELNSYFKFIIDSILPLVTISFIFGVLFLFLKNDLILEIQQNTAKIEKNVKLEVENSQKIIKKTIQISEELQKLVTLISLLRDATLRDMEQGVVLSQKSYEQLKLLMKSQLQLYDSDKTGLTDYALGISGGKILSTRSTETYNPGEPTLSFFGIPLCTQTNKAKAIIQTSVFPGECWAVKGHEAAVVIQLISKIYVTNISLEHIPQALSPTGEIDSAPKDFSIWGLSDIEGVKDAHFFGQFTYRKDGTALQTFSVQKLCSRQYQIIEFKLHSNHGHLDYTCIYRIRVHGKVNPLQY
uniref:SUN domain-containing protein n=2 Tax=Clastoptera arizonana TaxID=38151 RepID=A0A1B6C1S9_9HEMI